MLTEKVEKNLLKLFKMIKENSNKNKETQKQA